MTHQKKFKKNRSWYILFHYRARGAWYLKALAHILLLKTLGTKNTVHLENIHTFCHVTALFQNRFNLFIVIYYLLFLYF